LVNKQILIYQISLDIRKEASKVETRYEVSRIPKYSTKELMSNIYNPTKKMKSDKK
jgi:hypothetical protein